MITNKVEVYDFPLTKWFDNLLNNPRIMKQIKVTDYSREYPVTVQVFEDGMLSHCNHAGHQTEGVDKDYSINGLDREYTAVMEVCNKCDAASYDGIDWSE